MHSSNQTVKVNHLITIFLGATLVAANSSPTDLGTFAGPNDLSSGVTSFALPAEERLNEIYTLAVINYTYINSEGEKIIESGEIAKYGEGQLIDARGVLHLVTSANDRNDVTGCQSDLRDTVGDKLPESGWIALIKRGGCNFELKVKHVYMKGAVGAIIFNDKDSHTLDKMKINDKNRQIAAVFTTKKRGEEMEKLLRVGHIVTVDISKGTTCTKALPNLNRTSVLFVSISFIVLMIISLVWLVFYYVQRFRYLQTKDKQSRRLCNVAKRIISKIPTKSIKSDDKEIDNDCCAICIELYKVTDLIRVLPCKHEFHKACIDPWLLEHRTCPMCKMDILKHYGFVVSSTNQSVILNISSSNNSATNSEANTESRHVTDV